MLQAGQARAVVDAIARPIGVFQGARLIVANAAFAELVGVPAGGLAGREIESLFPPPVVKKITALLVDAGAGVIRVSPAVAWPGHGTVLLTAFPLSEGVGLFIEAGGQDSLETLLRGGAPALSEIERIARFGCYRTERRGGTFSITPELARIFDLPDDQTGSVSAFEDRVHPEDRATILAGRAELELHRPVEMSYRVVHRDGSIRHVQSRTEPVLEDGVLVGAVGVTQDITDQRLAELRLRESEARFRTLIDRIRIGVLVHGPGAEILMANPAALALLGVTFDELARSSSDPSWDVIGEDGAPVPSPDHPVPLAIATRAAVRNVVIGVYRPRSKDRIWLLVDADPELGPDGSVRQVLCTILDITERRTIEARLAISDRLASVGTLAAGIAHEVNNPLAYVFGNLEFLASELRMRAPDAPWARDLLDIAVEALGGARRVRDIVTDLRTFARGDDLRRGAVDAHKVLDSSLHLVWNQLRHAARVIVDVDEDLPPLLGNEARLGQIFVNLLVNAAQAIGSGHADRNEIRVTGRHVAGRVSFEVADTGPGIPPHALGRIFDPFFTIRAAGSGTGLGLFLCQRLVTELGGTLGVESELGVGTRFRLELPVATSLPLAPLSEPALPISPRRGRLLIIDDEVSIAQSLARVLAAEHEVVTATDARAAVAHLEDGRPFDVVICDVMMPEVSGIELYELLERRDPELAKRVIFVTGGAFTPAARAFLEGKERSTVEKPFDVKTIRRMIHRVLAEHGPAGDGR